MRSQYVAAHKGLVFFHDVALLDVLSVKPYSVLLVSASSNSKTVSKKLGLDMRWHGSSLFGIEHREFAGTLSSTCHKLLVSRHDGKDRAVLVSSDIRCKPPVGGAEKSKMVVLLERLQVLIHGVLVRQLFVLVHALNMTKEDHCRLLS